MIESLQEQRMELQRKGVDAQVREMELLRTQLKEQARIDDISLGFMRTQVADAERNAATYAQQLSLLGQAQAQQVEQAKQQNEYSGLLESEQNRMASNRARFNRSLVQRRQNARRQTYTSGVLTANERRAV